MLIGVTQRADITSLVSFVLLSVIGLRKDFQPSVNNSYTLHRLDCYVKSNICRIWLHPTPQQDWVQVIDIAEPR